MSSAGTEAAPLAYRIHERTFEFEVLRWTFLGLLSIASRWRVEGRENVPADGPLLVVSNHLHFMDPPLIGAVVPRPVYFMAKEELFDRAWKRWVVTTYRAFPIRRGASDRQALRLALDLLAQGHAIAMFPEGHRSDNAALIPAQPGIGLLALKSGAAVLPLAITGTHRVLPLSRPRAEVTVRIGKPFRVEVGDGPNRAQRAADQVMRAVADMLPPAYRGVYAGPATEGSPTPG